MSYPCTGSGNYYNSILPYYGYNALLGYRPVSYPWYGNSNGLTPLPSYRLYNYPPTAYYDPYVSALLISFGGGASFQIG